MPAVLFDLDGVLVDSRAAITACLNHALVSRGHPPQPETELYRFIGPPLVSAVAEIVGQPADSPEVLALVAAYRERYAVSSLTDTLVAPGIPAVLETLGADHALAVATSKPRPFAVPLLAALGLERHFDYVAGPELDAHMEPKAVTVRAALEHVGAPAVMVGDRSHDVVGAHANGIPVIGVTWGIGDAVELASADVVIESPEQLPAAVARLLRLAAL